MKCPSIGRLRPQGRFSYIWGLAVIVGLAWATAGLGAQATNVALGKPYRLSQKPNYPLAAPQTDSTSLTDGRFTSGFFWTRPTTVGWKESGVVEVILDLEKQYNVGGIVVSTARGIGSQVYYPAHVYAFVGPDSDSLLYVGDVLNHENNRPGGYEVTKFALTFKGVKTRLVVLEIVPKGHFVFCDEIQVLAVSKGEQQPGRLPLSAVRRWPQRAFGESMLQSVASYASERLPEWAGPLKALEKKHGRQYYAEGAFETEILAVRGQMLRNVIPGKEFLVEEVDPWGDVSPVRGPSPSDALRVEAYLAEQSYLCKALVVTNLRAKSAHFSIDFKWFSPAGPRLLFYLATSLRLRDVEPRFVPDPLLPVDKGFDLKAGESAMLFISVRSGQAGLWSGNFTLRSGKAETVIPITGVVYPVKLPRTRAIRAVNWAYLNRPAIKDREKYFADDLINHGINVLVVPPEVIPSLATTSPSDFKELEGYLLSVRNKFETALFFMGYNLERYRTASKTFVYLDDRWKDAFKNWYDQLINVAVRAGFEKNRLYLYPFDEMAGKDVDRFIALASWLRSDIPSALLYATVGGTDALRALPFLNIAQLSDQAELISKARAFKPEFWIYSSKGPAKLLSPYAYYRLMAWKAFVLGFAGIGFWNYSDFAAWGMNWSEGWDEPAIDLKKGDAYAVIYRGDAGGLLSSRRWEAWRMGIEDYELLLMYGKKMGEGAAKKLAEYVLEKPTDTSRADEVRRKILIELAQVGDTKNQNTKSGK